jgi:hypothetical protein
VFAAVAVAAGLACFSNRALELPLVPNQVEVLLTPLRQSLTLDSAFVALQLSYVLPALLLGVFWMRETTTGRAGAGVVAAIALHVAIALSWPGAEAWLRSTGAFAAAATAGVCSFLLLVAAVRERLDAVLAGQREAENEGAPPSQIVRWPELRAAGIALLFICGTLAVARGYTGRLVAHDGPARASRVWLPASWRASVSAASPAASRFALGSASGDSAVLTLETRPDTSATPLLAAQAVALEVGTRFAGFAPASLEGWDRFAPGAVAVEFSYYRQPEDSNSFALGTLAVVPAGEGSVLVATVTYGTQDTPRRWDVARLLSRLRESEVSAQRLGVSREGAPRRAAAAGRSPRASG